MKNWATTTGDELIKELQAKIEDYDKHLQTSGIMTELRDSYASFYGDSKVRDAGQQGELKAIRINHYASLIRNLVSLVCNNKPAWQPISSNTDSESQASSILASGLLDFYMKDRRLDRTFRSGCLTACFLREAWISSTWNTQLGEIVHPGMPGDEQSPAQPPIHEGDLQYNLFTLNDVIRDFHKTNADFDWLITREYKSKWDLVSQFPEMSDDIQSLSVENLDLSRIRLFNHQTDNKDIVPFYTFYFRPCAALPNGRMVTFIKDKMLTDSPLPYPKIPLVRLASEETIESCFAHSPMMDVLPVQKGIDMLASTLLSNNNAFGVQNLWSKKGNGLVVSQVAGGLNLIESETKPEPLQMTASAPETYKFFEMLVHQSQLLSGVNDAIRGQTSAGQSGAALALLSQQALQFANSLQQGYVATVEDVGTLSIQILQRYANTKRVAVLTGKHNRPLLKEWSSSDLSGISRITIESGNALSKTASGRLTMADSLMQAQMIKRPEQYISVLTTGQLQPIYENEETQLLLIRRENERLSSGQPVRALLTDDHENHILEHSSVLSNPDVRDNPDSPIVQNTLNHIQEHLQIAQNMPPALAMLLKQQPLPQQAPQQQNQSNAPGPQAAQSMDGTNSITTEAGTINGPSLPKNPATNQRIEPIQ